MNKKPIAKKPSNRKTATGKDFKRLARRVVRKVGTGPVLGSLIEAADRIKHGETAEQIFPDIQPLIRAAVRAKGGTR